MSESTRSTRTADPRNGTDDEPPRESVTSVEQYSPGLHGLGLLRYEEIPMPIAGRPSR